MGTVNPSSWMKVVQSTKAFEKILEKVIVTHLSKGKCTAELLLSEEHANRMGALHGGMSATLVDSLSTAALRSYLDNDISSVSVNMNLSYIKGAKVGDTIEINANIIKVGRTMAFLEAFIKNKTSRDLLVHGTHTKFLLHR